MLGFGQNNGEMSSRNGAGTETAAVSPYLGHARASGIARAHFERVPDAVRHRKPPLVGRPMSAMAMFFFKFPSVLEFVWDARGSNARPELVHILKTLFGIGHVPCDTSQRERLDEGGFAVVVPRLQGGVLGDPARQVLEGIPTIDGTEYFYSRSIGCRRCSRRRLRGGEIGNFHRTVCACAGGRGSPIVLPFTPKMVLKSDGEKKNDCESNAIKRLLRHLRREHPHPEIRAPVDGPRSKASQVRLLRELVLTFITGAKRGDHKILQEQLDIDSETCVFATPDGTRRVFRRPAGRI